MKKRKILIGCARSGVMAAAFEEQGWEAWECDVLPGNHHRHIQDNVLNHLNKSWDMGIFHPPCTRLCNSGVMWLEKRNLWKDMEESAKFFRKLLEADIPKKAVENPIPHKYALKIIGRKYDQIIQPWMFGHGETKATCLWLDNLPQLKPTKIVKERIQRLHYLPPSPERAWLRSITYKGIAEAMAKQWGATIR